MQTATIRSREIEFHPELAMKAEYSSICCALQPMFVFLIRIKYEARTSVTCIVVLCFVDRPLTIHSHASTVSYFIAFIGFFALVSEPTARTTV